MRGVLLVNLGSPRSLDVADVRSYLRELLDDPRVIRMWPPARAALVNLIIAPTRAPKSAEAYRRIWTPDGSPLLAYTRAFAAQLAQRLPDARVEIGMQCGEPKLEAALTRLADVEELVVVPLYPQYASAMTGSAMERVHRWVASREHVPAVRVIPPFFGDSGFIAAWRARLAPYVGETDHLLCSFHGVPLSHLPCRTGCDCVGEIGRHCYKRHCEATAAAIASEAAVPWSIAYQSRLGRDPWLGPTTLAELERLARAGVRRVAVACPSFVADCLETLEEIGMGAAEHFRAAGGESLTLVPSLNAEPAWVDAVARMIRQG